MALSLRSSAVDSGFRVRARKDFPGFGRRADMGSLYEIAFLVDIELPLKNMQAENF